MNLQGIDGMSEVSGVCYIPEDVTNGGRSYYQNKKDAGLFDSGIRAEIKRGRAVKAGCGIGDNLGNPIKQDLCFMLKAEGLQKLVRPDYWIC